VACEKAVQQGQITAEGKLYGLLSKFWFSLQTVAGPPGDTVKAKSSNETKRKENKKVNLAYMYSLTRFLWYGFVSIDRSEVPTHKSVLFSLEISISCRIFRFSRIGVVSLLCGWS
jgi:hypothetical protein